MPIFAYTTLDDPAATRGTFATGINAAGQVAGSYTDASGLSHGFIYAGGGYANFDNHEAGSGGDTLPDGINNLGQVVGTSIIFPQELAFIKIGNSYRFIVNPNNVNDAMLAHGINSVGEVVGEYVEGGNSHGFVYLRDLGVFAPFYDPGAPSVALNGINENGTLIVGQEGGAGVPNGIIWNGSFLVVLRDPFAGNSGTNAKGVNDSGQVVGYYFDAGGRAHGFLYSGGSSGGLASGTFTTIDVGARGTFINGINDAGQMVGTYIDAAGHDHGFVGSFQPNPAPGGGTTAALILRGSNSSAAIAGQYEIYDIGNKAILSAYLLGQAGTDFQFAGLGRFFDGDTVDMMLRSASTGAFEVYDINNNNITNAASLGAIGLNWQVAGFADFNGDGMSDMMMRNSGTGAFQVYNISNNAIINSSPVDAVGLDWQVGGFGNFASLGESDMVMRNTKTGALEIYDINDNQIANAFGIGMVGLDWQFSGVGNFSSNPGETDLLMRNGKTGALEVYDIANNQITGASSLGTVGLDWQFAGIAPVHAAGAADLVLRNVNTGAFEVYDIAGNQLIGTAPLGSVGLDWQFGGLGVDPPVDNSGDAAGLVQAMAGFAGGSGAADGLNAGFGNVDTSQQTFLTTPQHA